MTASPASAPEKKKPSMPWPVKFAIFSLLVAGFVFAPTSIVIIGCLLPTIVAAIVDRDPQKTMWMTVGACNLAGAVPMCFELWKTGHTVGNAISLLASPAGLAVAYGGAAVGWLIYTYVAAFVATMIVMQKNSRLKDIDKRLKELIKKWGEDVAKTDG